ncbi:MAG: hypothetical protein J6S14_11330, partial [Clostridia bacterium]|nr:hypothetical protein [Clostridia bacterium]
QKKRDLIRAVNPKYDDLSEAWVRKPVHRRMQSRPLRNGTAPREEQFARHEILRAPRGLRTRPQDDIVSFYGGFAPIPPFLFCQKSKRRKIIWKATKESLYSF